MGTPCGGLLEICNLEVCERQARGKIKLVKTFPLPKFMSVVFSFVCKRKRDHQENGTSK